MEIRKGMFEGEFYNFLKSCSQNELFKKLCPIPKKRVDREERVELVLRFFTYSDNYLNFVHEVSDFMDDYMEDKVENGFDKKAMKTQFENMLNFVEKYFTYGFKKSQKAKSTPRVRFEAIAVGVELALRENSDLEPSNVENWLNSTEFNKYTKSDAANNKNRVTGRFEYVKTKLLETKND